MSTDNSESNELNPPLDDAQTPLEAASSPPDTSTEFRYGDDAPEYLRGKTPAETLDLVTNLVSVAQQLAANQQQQPATQNTRQEPMNQPQQFQAPDPELALSDPPAYQAQLATYLRYQSQSDLAQYAQPVFNQLASTAKSLSKNNPENKDVWNKWGSEVEQMVAALPPHQRTEDIYNEAVVHVRGRHINEIAAERAQALAAANPSLAHSSADGEADMERGGNDAVWEKIESSSLGKATVDRVGKRGIAAMVNSRHSPYKSLEEYADLVSKSNARVDLAKGQVKSVVEAR